MARSALVVTTMLALGLVLSTSCTSQGEAVSTSESVPPTSSAPSIAAPETTRRPTSTAPPEPEAPEFHARVRETSVDELAGAWRSDCPVSVEALRVIEMPHVDDEGGVIEGSLVVHVDHVDALVGVFARLFEVRFPIHQMRPIAEFDGDDNVSMRSNNTSAFNCREIDGRPGVWSQHAFGGAVDINPLVNPWVRGTRVDPPEGAAFIDRSQEVVGLIRAGDVVTSAFAEAGWGWGGDWEGASDYQHFSHNGR